MDTNLSLTLFIRAFLIALIMLVPYEYYWNHVKHWPRSYDVESLGLWANERSKLDKLSSEDIVIMGSSRGHFDLNMKLWDSIMGRKPVMLAYPGSSPFHPIADVVENSTFKGLLLISVSPGLFFTVGDSWGAGRGKAFVDHYYNRTYAQRFNLWVFSFLDPLFGFLDPGLSYRNLTERIRLPNRDSLNHPAIWPPMVSMDRKRGVRMIPAMETVTILQKRQKDIWDRPVWKNRYIDSVDVILDHYVSLALQFKENGGRIAFIRPPVSGAYLENEPLIYPRKDFWDRLLEESSCPGFQFMDHPVTNAMEPPEWSHLSRSDADIYTRLTIDFLKDEELIKD